MFSSIGEAPTATTGSGTPSARRGNQASAMNILHVSDLHISERSMRDFLIVLDAFWDDLDRWAAPDIRPDIVCLTGDIAQSSKPEEYELARELFLDPLIAKLRIDPERLFWVPGNHDVDRAIVAQQLLEEE